MWSDNGETVSCDFCGKKGTCHIYKMPLSGKPMIRSFSVFDGHRMARFDICSKCFPEIREWLKGHMTPAAYRKSRLTGIRDAKKFTEYLEIEADHPDRELPCETKSDGKSCGKTPSTMKFQELRYCAACAGKFEVTHKVRAIS
jgi:hypothetical protein